MAYPEISFSPLEPIEAERLRLLDIQKENAAALENLGIADKAREFLVAIDERNAASCEQAGLSYDAHYTALVSNNLARFMVVKLVNMEGRPDNRVRVQRPGLQITIPGMNGSPYIGAGVIIKGHIQTLNRFSRDDVRDINSMIYELDAERESGRLPNLSGTLTDIVDPEASGPLISPQIGHPPHWA